MSIQDIYNYRPQIAKVESGAEPSLREVLEYFYTSHGISVKQAEKLADIYFTSLALHFDISMGE